MKKIYLFAALAAMLAACSENDLTKDTAVQQNAEEGAVQFSAYLNRGTTRAGVPGTLTTTGSGVNAQKVSLQAEGFGVLSYYNDGEPYSENSKPDFMYNQQVTYGGGTWQYTPVKYWPNEFGSDAISEGTDRLTFFAYAPYVEVDLYTGLAKPRDGKGEEETTGIIALTRNTTHGDPFVKYYADFNPDKRVDLCWGVAKEDFTSAVSSTKNDIKQGKPYIDVLKPDVSSKIYFDFKHALAALNVTIDADIDEAGHGINDYVDGFTKIWVRSITFEGFADKGMLNLNGSATTDNYTPEWYDLSGNNKIGSGGKTTIYDGLRDGSEPLGEASNETPAALNPQIIQSYAYDVTTADKPYITGLTTTTPLSGVPSKQPVNVFNSTTASEPIYVIPTNDNLKVTIVYDVETADKNLTNYLADGAVKGSCVENKITKEIKISGNNFKLQAGKLYTIALHLGMTSVKFDASVSEWGDAKTADETWLPANAPTATVTAAANGGHTTLNVLADGLEKGNLIVEGFTPGVDVTITPTTATGVKVISPSSPVKADANGKVNIVFSVDPNNTIKDIAAGLDTKMITVTGSGKRGVLHIGQNAHALDLQAPTIKADDGITITLVSGASEIDWSEIATNITITGKDKDGHDKYTLTGASTGATSHSTFKVEADGTGKAKLTLHTDDKVAAGDVYTITVAPAGTGMAKAESVTLKIGGIAFAQAAYSIEYGYAGFNPTPVYYGLMPSGYAYAKDADTYVDFVSTSTGEIKTIAVNTGDTKTVITATATQEGGNGYQITDNSKNASYNLKVTKAKGTISYTLPNVTGPTHTANQAITFMDATNTETSLNLDVAELKNSRGDRLTEGSDATDKAGLVSYEIVSVNGVTGTGPFVWDSSSNKLKAGSSGVSAGTYNIVMKATVSAASNENVGYIAPSVEAAFTLTITE